MLAKTLAEKLGWQFIDADLGLEFRVGRLMPSILGKEGEKAFYHCESEVLANLLSKEYIVVTTDVSIVCSEENRQLLASEFVVYLQVSTAVQIEHNSRAPAPLLPVADIEIFLDELHLARDKLFEKAASIVVNSDDSALDEHVLRIRELFERNAKQSTGTLKLEKKDLLIFHKSQHTPVQLTEQQARSLKLLASGKALKKLRAK